MADSESHQAVVEKLIPKGRHGPYAVARSETLGLITFSLDPKIWREENLPDPGTWVVLSQIRKKRAGWRAESGRFVKPSDEQKPVTEWRTEQ